MSPCRFFSFDGLDGVGKTTQIDLFCRWLEDQGHEVVICRDPGSTPLGEQVRQILLASDDSTPISARSEMLLYMAARAQLVDEVIHPALAQGKMIVSDRFLLANVVYQGHAGGLDLAMVREVGGIATDGMAPDCTFLLDMDPIHAFGRMGQSTDRIESRGEAYREKVRAGFLKEAKHDSESIHVINANRSIDIVQRDVREIAQLLLVNGVTPGGAARALRQRQ